MNRAKHMPATVNMVWFFCRYKMGTYKNKIIRAAVEKSRACVK
jgi:hypothetical protein